MKTQRTAKTIRGTVESTWNRDTDGVTLHVRIPEDTDAHVMAPRPDQFPASPRKRTATRCGRTAKYFSGDPGVAGAATEDSYVAFDVGSGEYTFTLRGQ
jgi:hypothetical protein